MKWKERKKEAECGRGKTGLSKTTNIAAESIPRSRFEVGIST